MPDHTHTHTSELYARIRSRAGRNLPFADFIDDSLSYRQLLASIDKLSHLFAEKHIRAGDKILIVTASDKHAITLSIAALLEGAVPTLLSVDTGSQRARAIAEKLRPRLIFTDNDLAGIWDWLETDRFIGIRTTSRIFTISRLFRSSSNQPSLYPDLLEQRPSREPGCNAHPDDLAFIPFTSGTTSEPKGILTTHENLFEHLDSLRRIFSYDEKSRLFNNLSLAHNDGFVQGPLLALWSGATLIRPPAFTVQNLETLLNLLYSKRVTHMITVPTILSLVDRLTRNNDYFEDEGFRHVISVAAKLDRNLWNRLQQRFGIRICNIYGLTETVAGGVYCGPGDDHFRLGTVGKPLDMEARIVDQDEQDCLPGQQGELWLRGRNVVPGYLDLPGDTAATFSGGWLHTGDLARMDDEGFIEIVGRKKAMIMSGGYNIHPDEINEVLMLHPDVAQAATIGLADPDWGELVASVVESRGAAGEAELIEHCRQHLEPYKVPKSVTLVDELPRGVSGKVILSSLPALIEASHPASPSGKHGARHEDILEMAARVFNQPVETLSLNAASDDTPGWDSLGHLNLITAAEEEFGIRFSMDEMMAIDSLQRLHSLIESKRNQ